MAALEPAIPPSWVGARARSVGFSDEDAARLQRLAAPAFALMVEERPAGADEPRLGGRPMLPVSTVWPAGSDGRPLTFLAAIPGAYLQLVFERPVSEGTLFVFADVTDLAEDPQFSRASPQLLLHAPAVQPMEPPPGVPTLREVATRVAPILTLPGYGAEPAAALNDLNVRRGTRMRAYDTLQHDLSDEQDSVPLRSPHRLGGWAHGIQGDPLVECILEEGWAADHLTPEQAGDEALAWRHLLTIGEWPGGPRLDDGGRITFAAPIESIRALRLNDVRGVQQSH